MNPSGFKGLSEITQSTSSRLIKSQITTTEVQFNYFKYVLYVRFDIN